ncbi:PKD domain-containing protein [Pollutibacter soli]|uniref:PKD domain-containing protein n=1 Tax=Pollutibacter soli TaxID=3034157 RepID=UPI00301360B9
MLFFFGLLTSISFPAYRKESTRSTSPVVVAAGNISIQLPHDDAVLEGSSSYDPDGEIVQYSRTKISDPDFITITGKSSSTAILQYLTAGEYKIPLIVTDDAGATGFETADVTTI